MPQKAGQGRGLTDCFGFRLRNPNRCGQTRVRRGGSTLRMAVRFCGMKAARRPPQRRVAGWSHFTDSASEP